jgi:TfoX/Sxy family transcriptional regulator of competence genes
MAASDPTLERILAAVDGSRGQPMFGCFGLYSGATFFGIVHRGRAYFHTTPATRPRYCSHGSGPFRFNAKIVLRDYYEVPAAILADDESLRAWAAEAIAGRDPRP